MSKESDIENDLICQLTELKYSHRPDITDRKSLEQNFKQKFEALNRVRLTENEYLRLREEIINADVFAAYKLLRERQYFQREDGTPLHYTLVNIKDWCKNDYEVVSQLRIKTENNHIDTVIGLPSNLFYSTGIPVCILVLKKCKKQDDVLFINASEHYEKGKRQNTLDQSHIEKIVETYQFRKEEDRYARKVSMEEIEKNGFNLNISRYISTAEEEVQIDLKEVNTQIAAINERIRVSTEQHNAFLRELGLGVIG